jgi:class 3 adenylate cyclase/quercetin dioxygenase-like cupin family protein
MMGPFPTTRGATMPRLQAKSFANSDVRTMRKMRIETVALDEAMVGHCTFEPGWRWSTDVAPLVGAASCPMRHFGYTMSGALRVVMDDGQSLEIGPGTVFEIPPGHDKWVIGDEPWVTLDWGATGRAMEAALNDAGHRSLATVMFTDIVASTATLERVGDAAWHDLLVDHNVRLREELNVFRGREVKTTGDGFLASFDGPARSIRCAEAIIDATKTLGVDLRIGLHTGECDVRGDDLGGLAVHIAARVGALATSGEVLVSGTVKDLVAGSGIGFTERGEHELRGVPGSWRLFALAR